MIQNVCFHLAKMQVDRVGSRAVLRNFGLRVRPRRFGDHCGRPLVGVLRAVCIDLHRCRAVGVAEPRCDVWLRNADVEEVRLPPMSEVVQPDSLSRAGLRIRARYWLTGSGRQASRLSASNESKVSGSTLRLVNR